MECILIVFLLLAWSMGVRNKYFVFLVVIALCSVPLAANANQINLTPNSNGQTGVLPDGYDVVEFSLSDGDWVPTVVLPIHPRDGAQVNLRTSAAYGVVVNTSTTDLGISQLAMNRNARYSFKYSASAGVWTLSGDLVRQLTPNDSGAQIPAGAGGVTYYSMWNGNWVPSVMLPPSASDGDVIVIKSAATYDSSIASGTLLYNSTFKIKQGDTYAMTY